MRTKTCDEKIGDALKWAREAAETTRAQIESAGNDAAVPSWLPELEAALQAVDTHEPSDIEIEMAEAADQCRPGPRY